MKTGSTVPSLLAQGEDFENWFIAGSDLPSSRFVVCSLHLGGSLPALDRLCGILITGSPANITENAPWNDTGSDYLRAARERGVPILGVCYGHQLVASAFGGQVDFNPQGRGVGTATITLTPAATKDPLLGPLAPVCKAQVSHAQAVLVLPTGAVRLATNSIDPNHAYRLGDSIWCVQFHPEFNARIMRAYIEQRAETIASEGLPVEALMAGVEETPEVSLILQRFVAFCEARLV